MPKTKKTRDSFCSPKSSKILSMPVLPLPKFIRDELRMTCALRGYSSIRQGEGMTIHQQHNAMNTFFHGKSKEVPSQIQLLSEGKLLY